MTLRILAQNTHQYQSVLTAQSFFTKIRPKTALATINY
jgi:hypothetical protein